MIGPWQAALFEHIRLRSAKGAFSFSFYEFMRYSKMARSQSYSNACCAVAVSSSHTTNLAGSGDMSELNCARSVSDCCMGITALLIHAVKTRE